MKMNEEIRLESFEQYFDEIKNIWRRLEQPNRVIPFCTPLVLNPKFLIIGTNHSNNFNPHDEIENNRIADSYSNELPREHTFLEHQHPFAKALRRIVSGVKEEFPDFDLTEEWLGTNRCAVQTDSDGITNISRHSNYKECEKEMDLLLKAFVRYIKPKNVILTGEHACRLYYPKGPVQDMPSKKSIFGKGCTDTFNLIPVKHFSAGRRPNEIIQKITDSIKDGFCDYL
jgi:hypothetical protein